MSNDRKDFVKGALLIVGGYALFMIVSMVGLMLIEVTAPAYKDEGAWRSNPSIGTKPDTGVREETCYFDRQICIPNETPSFPE